MKEVEEYLMEEGEGEVKEELVVVEVKMEEASLKEVEEENSKGVEAVKMEANFLLQNTLYFQGSKSKDLEEVVNNRSLNFHYFVKKL